MRRRKTTRFWGAKIDWQINDRNLLELLAFSDENEEVRDAFGFTFPDGPRGAYEQTRFTDNGGMNWSATYTGYLTDNLSDEGAVRRKRARVLALQPERPRMRTRARPAAGRRGRRGLHLDCERGRARRHARSRAPRFRMGRWATTSCASASITKPTRPSTSSSTRARSALLYEVRRTGTRDARERRRRADRHGATCARVRTRSTASSRRINSAYYLEDNWSVTDSLVLNAGVRVEAFDNKNADGDSYIKIDDMVAPRVGFSWDVKGDNRSKLFGNAGRYFLPVANVINIKQAGGFLDRAHLLPLQRLRAVRLQRPDALQRPILGAQIGAVDDSQGDGTVGDLRGEVDADMDPVYQDELILGFQSMIDDKWSWGVRGIYRKLNNAIDDMEITSTGIMCGGEPVGAGFVMANPGRAAHDLHRHQLRRRQRRLRHDRHRRAPAGRMFDDDGNYVGDVGFRSPKRTYKALEFMIDRAWDDKWSLNATYTLSYSKGNAEGPVNSDTNFADTGRTEAFDDPWVNYGRTAICRTIIVISSSCAARTP